VSHLVLNIAPKTLDVVAMRKGSLVEVYVFLPYCVDSCQIHAAIGSPAICVNSVIVASHVVADNTHDGARVSAIDKLNDVLACVFSMTPMIHRWRPKILG